MNQEEYRIRKAGINGKIKQAKGWIDFYEEKIEKLKEEISVLNKAKDDLLKEKEI